MNTFYFEMTDTFGGELNYCWLHRFTVNAKSVRGALNKISRETGLHFRYNGINWKAKNACIALYEYSEFDMPDSDWISKSKTL